MKEKKMLESGEKYSSASLEIDLEVSKIVSMAQNLIEMAEKADLNSKWMRE